jgi:hypothetical protein
LCKYCVHIYANGKIRPVETIPRTVRGRIKENDGGVNSSMIYLIYCKNICKYHNVPPPSTIKKREVLGFVSLNTFNIEIKI